mmetsp:Transcript_26313/g.60610  ORF Transcript_26313/g.60610 Transcript_26313/m.60610 type:complete len:687 (-) Transcript_26313:88-2148(-)
MKLNFHQMKVLNIYFWTLSVAWKRAADASKSTLIGRSLPTKPDPVKIFDLYTGNLDDEARVSGGHHFSRHLSSTKSVKNSKSGKTKAGKKSKSKSGSQVTLKSGKGKSKSKKSSSVDETKELYSEFDKCKTKIQSMTEEAKQNVERNRARYSVEEKNTRMGPKKSRQQADDTIFFATCLNVAEKVCSLQDDLYFQHFLNVTSGECYAEESYQVRTFHEFEMGNYDNVMTKEELGYRLNNPDDFPCVEGDWYWKEDDDTLIKNNGCVNDPGVTDPKKRWCSTKTKPSKDKDGNPINLHVRYNIRYCNPEGFDLKWEELLSDYDTNNDGVFALEEVVPNLASGRAGIPAIECSLNPDEMCNGFFSFLSPNCYEWARSLPSYDDVLVRMLGSAAKDAYQINLPGDPIYDEENVLQEEGVGGYTWIRRVHFQPICNPTIITESICTASFLASLAAVFTGFDSGVLPYVPCIAGLRLECGASTNMYQFAVYEVLRGEHIGEHILAYMGTNGYLIQFTADADVAFGGGLIRYFAGGARGIYEEMNEMYGIKFITGHSLGGITAEMVTDTYGVKGASFGALGGYSPNPGRSLLTEGNYDDVVFDVIVHRYDNLVQAFSNQFDLLGLGIFGGTSNVALSCNIRWTTNDCNPINPASCHSSEDYARYCSSNYYTVRDGEFEKNPSFIDDFDSVSG